MAPFLDDVIAIRTTAKILPQEDLSYKKTILHEKTEEIAVIDNKFCKLASSILVEESDGKGNIIDAIVDKANEHLQKNQILLESIDEEFNRLIDSYDKQVDAMKTQDMTLYYRKIPDV